ncbi:zf-HC2 domain-containing protein [Streptomyces zagrosensis]|uniref:zf-HC2 domain-containing protein n=1 Tax=Streptomyces zagrosensis TaxID=1042984 RepID=UPI001C8672A8|nr:zf-HC2 domain-containing protein [Streptomyces zagrosensis]
MNWSTASVSPPRAASAHAVTASSSRSRTGTTALHGVASQITGGTVAARSRATGGGSRPGPRSGDHGRVHCSDTRTALSARVDGEALPPGITGPAVDAHLHGCANCRHWERHARTLRELTARIGWMAR